MSRRLVVSDGRRALVITLLVGLPAWLAFAYWLNREHLPGFFEFESLAGNAGLLVAAGLVSIAASRGLLWASGRVKSGWPRAGWVLPGLVLLVHAAGLYDRDRFRGPDVFVILIDVLRADHLGVYGYERETSPNIDRFAQDSVVFDKAISQSTFTKTSVSSLFTGLYPYRHKVYRGGPDVVTDEGKVTSDVLSASHTTLAEALLDEGFLTAAWVENPQLRAYMGFDQGFVEYHDQPGSIETIRRQFSDWIDRWGERNRCFAYLHVLELHGPYEPEPPWKSKFGVYTDRFEGMDWREWRRYNKAVNFGQDEITTEEVEQLRALYDAQIAYVDSELGLIFDKLKADGLYDDALILITGDHGEAFMEHGFLTHSNTAYEELVHVPLIVKLPRSHGAGRRVQGQVALVDVAPTLVQHVNGQRKLDVDGLSLLGTLRDGAPLEERSYIYSELSNHLAIRSDRWKYIQYLERPPELYDLAADPKELVNVIDEHSDASELLRSLADHAFLQRESGESEEVAVDPEDVRKLQALGYM